VGIQMFFNTVDPSQNHSGVTNKGVIKAFRNRDKGMIEPFRGDDKEGVIGSFLLIVWIIKEF